MWRTFSRHNTKNFLVLISWGVGRQMNSCTFELCEGNNGVISAILSDLHVN